MKGFLHSVSNISFSNYTFRLLLAMYLPISNEPKVIAVNSIANAQSSGSGEVTPKTVCNGEYSTSN
jgi:hypothetical protein